MNFLFNINVCRVCMQNEQSYDLLKDKDLLEKFTYTTRLTISERDNLPKVICSNCTVRLKVAHKFIQNAHESESNLKKFLAKISNEFKEVTQSSRQEKTAKHNESSCEQNLTEDDIQTLIREDEMSVASISGSNKSNEYEKSKVKRKTSPIKEPPSKALKRESKCVEQESDALKLKRKSQQTAKVVKQESQKKLNSSYAHLSEEMLLIHSEKSVIELENDEDNFMENEDKKVEEEQEQEQDHVHHQEGELEEDFEQDHHHEDQEEDDDINDDIPDTYEIRDQEETNARNHETHNILEDHDQYEDIGNHDTREDTIDNHEEDEDTKHHGILEMTIGDDNVSQTSTTELTELTLEGNQLHQSLDENPPDIENIVANNQQDGYLREYETMITNQNCELQYHTDYIEENSIEENPLKDNDIIYTQKLEDDEEIFEAVDASEDVIKYEDAIEEMSYQETNIESNVIEQRDKVKESKTLVRKELQKLNRFYCEQCNRDFSTKTNLNRHMLSHEGNKPHVCPQCSKSFSQKSTLKQHMYTHTGERPYVCDVCTRGFTQCKSLIFHMRRHTGEKPFQCEYCLIMFRQKDALRASNYAIVGDDMSFFQPCEPQENDGNTDLADLVQFHLTHDYADDMETIITSGNITINADVSPEESIMVDIEIYEWKRGQWVNTVYSMKRPNFCVSAFDRKELWYPYVMQFPAEERVCPPNKGHVYHLKDIGNRLELFNVNVPGDLSGKYKATFHFVAGEYSTCISTIANIWRI